MRKLGVFECALLASAFAAASLYAQQQGGKVAPAGDSPDHKPLVAFVMGLRTGSNGPASARAATAASKPAPGTASTAAPPAGDDSALVAKGKERFQAYKCYDCHGEDGEGTPDAPDLTHSKLTAEQVSKFLQKPSVDAQNKGMPDVPADSPDHKPLVAYVMSLRAK